MARAPDPRVEEAHELFKKGMKLVEIASQLNLPDGTVRRWKSTYKWDNERSDTKSERSKRKRGGQPGNKNADGGPPGNKKAEKHGFFTKWLPKETMEIMQEIEKSDPLDILWDNIQLQYTAIVRAQKLMYVKNQRDKTIEKIEEKDGNVIGERWEVQQAWDKHATFLQAQSRAMKTLESMIKQYDEMLHKNWDLATEEQKARIAVLKAKAQLDDGGTNEDDGFIEALAGKVDEVWQD